MNQKCIQDMRFAIEETLKELKKEGYVWKNIRPINKGRYCIVDGFGCDNIAIMLKGDTFHNFWKLDESKYGKSKTNGDSINVEDLKQMVQNDVKQLYTKFRNGALYVIDLNTLLLESIKWTNKEGKVVRSWNIHLYKRCNK